MKNKSKIIASLSLAVGLVFGAIVIFAPKSSAVVSENSTILMKAYKEGVYQSYAKGCMRSSFNTQDIVANMSVNAGFGWYANNQVADSCSALLPPIYFDDVGNGNAGHVALNNFYDGVDSSGSSIGIPSAITKVSGGSKTDPTKGGYINDAGYSFLDGMNYEKGASSGEICFRMWYLITAAAFNSFGTESFPDEKMYGTALCVNSSEDANGEHVMLEDPYTNGPKDSTIGFDNADAIIKFNVNKSDNKVTLDCATWQTAFSSLATPDVLLLASAAGYPSEVTFFNILGDGKCAGKAYEYTPGSTTFESLRNGIMTDIVNNVGGFRLVSGWFGKTKYSYYNILSSYQDTRSGQIVESTTINLKDGTGDERGLAALQYLSGSNDYSKAKLSEDEIIILYSAYVRDYYGITDKLPNDDSSATVDKTGYSHIKLVIFEGENVGHMEDVWVKVKNGTNKVPGVYLVSSSDASQVENQKKSQHILIDVDFATIANYLKNVSASRVIDPDLVNQNKTTSANVTNPADQPGEEDGNTEPTDSCYTKAGSLGWILCPIIDELGTFVRDKYPQWVAPALQINTNLFGADGSRDTYNAWNVFRNIANVAFVIIFLVIIFSQLTGVGIDNYGIKKILPKLIIGAILINLSYVICQLAIDVANIVGYGVGGIFQGISKSIGEVQSITLEGVTVPGTDGDVGWLQGGGGLALVCVAVVGAISAIAVLSQGTAIIIPVLLAVLGIAISFFTLIAILAMRQAAAVLLVVASPLAFVAYMLPNTKKIFDKWMKVFQGLLLAFPACSALLYGGDMVGRILLNCANGSSWVVFSAGVVSIAPVFFIPKLIKSSMGAVSNAASKITGGLNRGINKGIGGSQWAKNLRADNERRRMLNRSGYKFDKNGNPTRTARGWLQDNMPFKTQAAKNRIARYRSAAMRDVAEAGQASRMLGAAGERTMANYAAASAAKLENQDVQDQIAAMANDPAMNSMSGLQNEFTKLMEKKGSLSSDDKLRLKAVATKLSASGAGNKFMSTQIREGKNNEETLREFAQFGAKSDVGQKIGAKDMYASQYLEELAAQKKDEKTKKYPPVQGFNSWMDSPKDGKDGAVSNRDWVTEQRLNKNDLFSQGSAAVEDALKTRTAGGEVSATRIDAALRNNNLDMDDKVKGMLRDRLKEQKAAAEASGAATTEAQPAPAQTQTQTTQTAPAPAPAQTQTQTTQTAPAPAPAQTQTQSDQPQRFAPRTQMAIENERAQAILNNPGSGPRARREAQEILDRNNNRNP